MEFQEWRYGWAEKKEVMEISAKCPQCGSRRIYKAEFLEMTEGPIQRFQCAECGRRFTNHKPKMNCLIMNKGRICAILQDAENLTSATETKTVAMKLENTPQETKGKIIEYCFHLQKQAYSSETIRLNRTALKVLVERGAELLNPESVKEVIAKQKTWSEARRRNVINAYGQFLKFNGVQWEKPKCHVTRPFPFIPTEREIDMLIAGCGRKTATFLELLKQTAMRSGEAKRLEWTNIDFEKNIITLNLPEKRSNPRMWKGNQKLIDMLNALPRKSRKVFGDGPINSMKTTFQRTRKNLAVKLQNPRLTRISFHTLGIGRPRRFITRPKIPIMSKTS